jgi:hypothetical protein
MDKIELNNKTKELAKKIAFNTNSETERLKIAKLKNEIKDMYYNHLSYPISKNNSKYGPYTKNLQAFASVKTDNLIKEIKNLDPKDIVLDADAALEGINARYNDAWLKSEYEIVHAVNTNDKIWDNYLSAQKDNPKVMVVYKTSEDDLVRDDHAILNNITLPPDDPFWDEYCPGEWDFNCRCYSELVYDEEADDQSDVDEWTKNIEGPDQISDSPIKIFDIKSYE